MPDLHVLFLPAWYTTPEVPSAGIFFRKQAVALSKAGVKVGLIYPDIAPPTSGGGRKYSGLEISISANEIVEMRLRREGLRPLRPWLRYWATRRLIIEYQQRFGTPDLVHAHGAVWAGVIASFFPLPYVITEHWTGYAEGLVRPWQIPLIRRAFAKAKARLAVSSALREDLRPYVGEHDVRVLPNVVDTDFFTPPPSRPGFPPLRILSVALFNPRKRLDTVIRALDLLVKRGVDVVLDLGGDGPQMGELRALAHNLGVGERVRFLGHLSPEGVRQAMHGAHIFVLPSEYETFGVVYAEALSCGLPVIATDRGGPRDFIGPEVGRLVPPGSVEAVVDAVLHIWENYGRFDPRDLHDHAAQRFSEDVISGELIDIYKDALAGGV